MASRPRSLISIAFMVSTGTIGCEAMEGSRSPAMRGDDAPIETVGRAIYVPTCQEEECLFDFQELLDTDAGVAQVSQQALEIVKRANPYVVANAMHNLGSWSGRGVQHELAPVVEEALASSDPFIRWAGLEAADEFGYEEVARRGLSKDFWCLLIRPDPAPSWSGHASAFERVDRAAYVAHLRARVIALVGEYNLQEAMPVLEVIIHDPHEWFEEAKEAARNSLDMLAGPDKPRKQNSSPG